METVKESWSTAVGNNYFAVHFYLGFLSCPHVGRLTEKTETKCKPEPGMVVWAPIICSKLT